MTIQPTTPIAFGAQINGSQLNLMENGSEVLEQDAQSAYDELAALDQRYKEIPEDVLEVNFELGEVETGRDYGNGDAQTQGQQVTAKIVVREKFDPNAEDSPFALHADGVERNPSDTIYSIRSFFDEVQERIDKLLEDAAITPPPKPQAPSTLLDRVGRVLFGNPANNN